jgi:biopolymer transport protein ExbB
MVYTLLDYYNRLLEFMDAGGIVLWFIACLTFVMWLLVIERFWYFRTVLRHEVGDALAVWQARSEHASWYAVSIRRLLISRIVVNIRHNMTMIKTLVALCPLLGLLGTVTGMIDVFNVLAVSGGGDVRAMAGGVSRATIPTMAGMVAALSGVFAHSWLERVAMRETLLLQDHLTRDAS